MDKIDLLKQKEEMLTIARIKAGQYILSNELGLLGKKVTE